MKTFGKRERSGKKGEVIKYQRNIYLHFFTKYQKEHDSNFAFEKIVVTKKTLNSLSMLEARGVTFER